LALVRDSLTLLTQNLRETDTVAIVAYGSTARVVLEPTAVADRGRILDAVAGLRSEGSTNAEAGLAAGYQVARTTLAAGRANRVILASDGVANVGLVDPTGLVAQLRDDADAGIKLITLGVGMGDYNDPLMEQLADQGDGFYAYLDDIEEADRLFTEELTASLITVAEDARTQVTFHPDVVASYRLVGYENRDIADERFRDDTVDAGEIGAGHSVVAVYELRLHPGARPDQTAAVVDLRWLEPGHGEGGAIEVRSSVTVEQVTRSWESADALTRYAGTVAAWAEVVGQRGEMTGRGVDFDAVAATADGLGPEATGLPGFAEFRELLERTRSS
jgi:Ca-activated chloride channel family protein